MDHIKKSKNNRVLEIYVKLCQGKVILKRESAKMYGVDERSIQRDIDDIRAFLDEQEIMGENCGRKIVYDRIQKGFVMKDSDTKFLENGQILAISKILLESRAFTKKEIDSVITKVITECVSQKNRKIVTDLISNEQFHYVEITDQSHIQEKIWDIGIAITKSNIMKLMYQKQNGENPVERVVEPLAIMFSEYYFYLIAYIVELNKVSSSFQQIYQYPAVFRIDRILSCQVTDVKFKIPYKNRFEEGVFRKRVQFMYPGELMKIQFKYTGKSLQAVLDRLPTARVLKTNAESDIIEAEVYGTGIVMWLLSQGESVEVLKPIGLRKQIQETLKNMMAGYMNEDN